MVRERRNAFLSTVLAVFLLASHWGWLDAKAASSLPGGSRDVQANETLVISQSCDPSWVSECQNRLREKVEICDDLFNSEGSVYYRDTVWHRECLANARTEFDNCLSLC